MNCHETIDLMGDALEGSLAPERQPGFDEHLEECPPCRAYFDQLRVTLLALERLPRTGATSQRRSDLISEFQREWQKGK